MIRLNTSVQDIKLHVSHDLKNNHLTVHNLKDAIQREKKGKNRSSIINYLAARANELTTKDPSAPTDPPKKKTITAKTEIVGADWTLARQLFGGMQLTIRLTLAQQVFLGAELERIKKELGFLGAGRRKKKVANLATLTWKEHLAEEMPDLPDRTADHIITVYHGAKAKLKKIGHTKGLALFDKSPDKLSKAQHKQLVDLTHQITDGETQTSLLEDLKIIKGQQKTTIGGAVTKPAKKPKATMEQIALALFTEPVQQLCKLRANSSYKKAIHALPITSDDPEVVTLASLKQQSESWNKEINAAMEKAMKGKSESKS